MKNSQRSLNNSSKRSVLINKPVFDMSKRLLELSQPKTPLVKIKIDASSDSSCK